MHLGLNRNATPLEFLNDRSTSELEHPILEENSKKKRGVVWGSSSGPELFIQLVKEASTQGIRIGET